MDAIFPAIMKNLPTGTTMSPNDEAEMRDFVSKTTQSVFGALGNPGSTSGGLDGLMSSLLGSIGGAGGIMGGGAGMGLGMGNMPDAPGSYDIHEHVDVNLEDYFRDTQHSVKYHARVWDGQLGGLRKKKRKVTLTLPSGCPATHTIQVDGQGHFDVKTHTTGTLYVHFRQKSSDMFVRHGQDLHMTFHLDDFRTDAFGFERFIAHPMGRVLKLSVDKDLLRDAPLGFNGRTKITVPALGIPRFEDKPAGSLVVNVLFNPALYAFKNDDFVFQGARGKFVPSGEFTSLHVKNPAWISPPTVLSSVRSTEPSSSPDAVEEEPSGVNVEDDDDDSVSVKDNNVSSGGDSDDENDCMIEVD
jgi:hypothetical protein